MSALEQCEPHRLDVGGRCPRCARQPLAYKRERMFFCCRCDRSYSWEDGEQINNWAWRWRGDRYIPTYPESEAANLPWKPLSARQIRDDEARASRNSDATPSNRTAPEIQIVGQL